jgi:putative hemolysin
LAEDLCFCFKIKIEQMKQLLNTTDLLKAEPALHYFGGEAFARLLMYILRLNKINKMYDTLVSLEGQSFVDELLNVLGVRYLVEAPDLERIPETGGFITVSNHPFGGVDGILLMKMLAEKRPDVKILANFLLSRIEPLSPFFLTVNPFEERSDAAASISGLKAALNHVRNGGALCIFPSGEVSSFDQYFNISDIEWKKPVLKLIKKAEVSVVPIYFSGSNSLLFHVLGLVHPRLRTIKLPSELLNKKAHSISIRIGTPISVKEQCEFENVLQYGRFLRAKTYCLQAPKTIAVKNFFKFNAFQKQPQPILPEMNTDELCAEIESIRSQYYLFSVKNYALFCAPTTSIPLLFSEIGRLREITFREVGEGTNQATDIDEYDLYYHQLFIWDEEERCIVGAYRIGMGQQIVAQYGLHGFYIHSLFRLRAEIIPLLSQSLELGRSFIVKDYQRKPLPLFLLWKGLLYFLLKNPEYRYLIGPVSISNNYSPVSKDSIIRFITTNYFDQKIAAWVKPRKAHKFVSDNESINHLLKNIGGDLNKFDKMIGDIDHINKGLPVLVKKYLSLNAKIVAFNVDPGFNNCLDGLIVLDIFDVQLATIESLSKEVNDGSLLERFYSSRELVKSDN